nr:M14 metal carboxypeptidase-like 18 [Antheraea pernyi]
MRSGESFLTYKDYINYSSLITITKTLAHDNQEIVKVVELTPKSAENRTLLAIELRSDRQSRKPGILVVGALNGMVWGAPNAILELADKFIYNINYQTPFFNDYDWYLIPTGNPDGLHFTQSLRSFKSLEVGQWSRNVTARAHTRPSQWHKNVDKDIKKDICFGTNVNRNFAYHWQDDVHKTPERCSQFYPGSKPFSTAEARALRTYIDGLGDVIHLAIHLQASFVPKKEFIIYPWRYSLRQPNNYHKLQEIGEYAARQARLADGRLYEVHQGSSDAQVAGTLSDYISGVVGVELVFIVKPYHELFPDLKNSSNLDLYVKKAITAVLSLVRGWRSSTKQNTLSFFGKNIEF